jgi:hypothetical protein
MRNILIIIKHEIVTTLQKRSFWIMTILFPGLIIFFNVGTQLMAGSSFSEDNVQGILSGMNAPPEAIAYVDEANLIKRLPDVLPLSMLHSFASETEARAALKAGEFDSFFLITADYVTNGELIVITQDFRPFNTPNEDLLAFVLAYNLTGDEAMASALLNPYKRHPRTSPGPAKWQRPEQSTGLLCPVRHHVHFLLPHQHEQRLHAAKRFAGKRKPHSGNFTHQSAAA